LHRDKVLHEIFCGSVDLHNCVNGLPKRGELGNRQSDTPKQNDVGRQVMQVSITYETGNSNIGIDGYTLISNNAEAHRADAEAVMQVKQHVPLAVHTKDRAVFEKILVRDFVFRGEPGMLRRENYMSNRTNPSGGNVLTADYENIALQCFGDIAVMTYRRPPSYLPIRSSDTPTTASISESRSARRCRSWTPPTPWRW
jgi:hypothetical protein